MTHEWEMRIADAWASIGEYDGRDDEFRALIDRLAAELPDGDPIAAFERAARGLDGSLRPRRRSRHSERRHSP